jgi:hypothetical protein
MAMGLCDRWVRLRKLFPGVWRNKLLTQARPKPNRNKAELGTEISGDRNVDRYVDQMVGPKVGRNTYGAGPNGGTEISGDRKVDRNVDRKGTQVWTKEWADLLKTCKNTGRPPFGPHFGPFSVHISAHTSVHFSVPRDFGPTIRSSLRSRPGCVSADLSVHLSVPRDFGPTPDLGGRGRRGPGP